MLGIVNNSDGLFRPDEFVTREQTAVMLINYFQCSAKTDPDEGYKFLGDLEDASDWARDAVARAYGIDTQNLDGYMEAQILAIEDDYGNPLTKGVFNPKGLLSREDALLILARLSNEDEYSLSSTLGSLNLRGMLPVDMDTLSCGFYVSNNTVSMLKSDFDYNSNIKHQYRNSVPNATTADLLSTQTAPGLTTAGHIFKNEVLSGERKVADFEIIKFEYNKNGYAYTMTRDNSYGYTSQYGSGLLYDAGEGKKFKLAKLIN
jgi:hypothetical protein